MEKTVENNLSIIDKNEKIIANILHDIKSPLYSIKIGLQNKLDTELNRDIFETAIDVIEYVENFLVNYSFKTGKFENKITKCDIKKIIEEKLEGLKYVFINKKIKVDFKVKEDSYNVCSIKAFLSSIIGNIISNIAFHASNNQNAIIELYKENSFICVNFQNTYNEATDNFSLGLDFCSALACATKTQIKFNKTHNSVTVNLKIPELGENKLKRHIIGV